MKKSSFVTATKRSPVKKMCEVEMPEKIHSDTQSRTRVPPDYFKCVHPLITGIIVIGLFVFVLLMAYFPHLLLYMHLGAVGRFLHDISIQFRPYVKGFFLFCMAIHTTEGLVGFYLSRFRHRLNWWPTVKWTISSFVNGYFALKMLFNPTKVVAIQD